MIPLLASGQDKSHALPSDSSEISVRTVDEDAFRSLTSEREFEYNEPPKNPASLWSRIRAWLFQLLGSIFQSKWASVFIRIAFIGIFAAVLIAIINQILGGKLTTSFTGKKTADDFSLNISEEVLHQKNYDELLRKAVDSNNFKDAVRILYLKALRELSQADLILWKADKTNSDYLRELSGHPAKSTFTRLTFFYEYVEYGDFRIDEVGFNKFWEIYQNLEVKN
ncbi:DUF4129 domain-containing protein [Gracilimonas tropica]|uniref:DUF4129 domain-containing protein n=1 Tax=Gracilimonas tropica TaxID=454600 RepID=UPI001B7FD4C6|nr:DUF4129 domain-containing protein [Gracilimonas tropica]